MHNCDGNLCVCVHVLGGCIEISEYYMYGAYIHIHSNVHTCTGWLHCGGL